MQFFGKNTLTGGISTPMGPVNPDGTPVCSPWEMMERMQMIMAEVERAKQAGLLRDEKVDENPLLHQTTKPTRTN